MRASRYAAWLNSERMTADTAHEFGALGRADLLAWAQKHYNIIARFGRFAHRNAALGRASTPQEIEFLKQPGSSF